MHKLGFMHIAKTAGSSINRYFEDIYGESRSISFAEHAIHNVEAMGSLFEKYDFVSGHLFYGHFAKLAPNVKTFTVLRNPYAHLISQIMWISSYNHESKAYEFAAMPREVRDLIQIVGRFDLSSVHQLDELLTHLPPYGLYLFNNLQSRYLIGDSANMDPLSLSDASYAVAQLEKFSYCCATDTLEESIPRLVRELGGAKKPFEQYVNKSATRSPINASRDMVRRVLQKHILVDLVVYEKVVSRTMSNSV